ncbi:MAG: hypothetical protein ACK5G9_04635 [Akkermansiaceae bacterium]|jgi:hypothetical protein
MLNCIKNIVGFFARWIAKLLLIATVCLIIQGISGVYYASRENKQTVISCKDFLAKRPNNKWLKITDAKPVFSKLVAETQFNKVSKAYIPLIPAGSDLGANTSIILCIEGKENPALQEMVDAGENLGKQFQALSKIMASSEFKKPVEGMVRYGIDDDDETRRDLQKLIPNLEANYAILEIGEIPSMSKSFAKFGYAFICFVLFMIFGFISGALKKSPPTISSSQSTPPPLPT